MIRIRKILPTDVQAVLDVLSKENCDTEGVLANIQNFMVFEDGNIIKGCGCSIRRNDKCYLNFVLVNKEDRRNKIGSSIIKALLNVDELNGAKEAYFVNSCSEFADYLKFKIIDDVDEHKKIHEIFNEIYNVNINGTIYKVSLINYFKPCCNQK